MLFSPSLPPPIEESNWGRSNLKLNVDLGEAGRGTMLLSPQTKDYYRNRISLVEISNVQFWDVLRQLVPLVTMK